MQKQKDYYWIGIVNWNHIIKKKEKKEKKKKPTDVGLS